MWTALRLRTWGLAWGYICLTVVCIWLFKFFTLAGYIEGRLWPEKQWSSDRSCSERCVKNVVVQYKKLFVKLGLRWRKPMLLLGSKPKFLRAYVKSWFPTIKVNKVLQCKIVPCSRVWKLGSPPPPTRAVEVVLFFWDYCTKKLPYCWKMVWSLRWSYLSDSTVYMYMYIHVYWISVIGKSLLGSSPPQPLHTQAAPPPPLPKSPHWQQLYLYGTYWLLAAHAKSTTSGRFLWMVQSGLPGVWATTAILPAWQADPGSCPTNQRWWMGTCDLGGEKPFIFQNMFHWPVTFLINE